ncbi:glycosyltransferase family 4 protein [Geobacter sp. AOG1]|uniref:glycosyltransferase family 4 protein n=1 Tax=Geobacter sp. AOG1 TaxID=1566346 RepID=UPI001CC413C0|nr:glycosyltransferase family 4 protein [Geobacter sp. AOG1]
MTPSKLQYLPIFFDDGYLSTIKPIESEHPFICIVGSLKSYQNYSAVIYTLEKLWPSIQRENSNIFLYVIGDLPPANSAEHKELMLKSSHFSNVIFTGQVDSVIPYVKAASVNIAPIMIGSGIRTKIIESVACLTPVVSTSIGAEGLPFIDGHSIHISDNSEEFAEKVIRLIGNCTIRSMTITNAYNIYQEQFSHEAGIKRLTTVLDAVLSLPERSVAFIE